MANRPAALGVVVLCVLALGVAAAGLPALSPEPVADTGVPESENTSVGTVTPVTDGADDPTPSGASNASNDGPLPAFRGVVDRALGGLPAGFSDSGGSESGADSGPASLLRVPGAVVGVVGLALVAAVLTLRSVSGSVEESVEEEGDDDPAESEAAVAAAASRAADAIDDDVAVENAVYRAWYEMTAALEVPNPEAATPGEFAAAARDAGLDPAAVADLTSVFEVVRYGEEPAGEYEDRALAALRQVASDADIDASAVTDRAADSDGGDAE